MSDPCPELWELERDQVAAGVRTHANACMSCRLVLELVDERRASVKARDRGAECDRFEMLLAVRDDGSLGATAATLLGLAREGLQCFARGDGPLRRKVAADVHSARYCAGAGPASSDGDRPPILLSCAPP